VLVVLVVCLVLVESVALVVYWAEVVPSWLIVLFEGFLLLFSVVWGWVVKDRIAPLLIPLLSSP
jgi:hypothetical protein